MNPNSIYMQWNISQLYKGNLGTITRINLEGIMLSEISQPQIGFHLKEVPRIVKFTETESRMAVARGWGGKPGDFVSDRYRVSAWENEKGSGDRGL